MFRFIIFFLAILVFVRCDKKADKDKDSKKKDDKKADKFAEEIMTGLMLDAMAGLVTQYYENFLSCVFVPMRGDRYTVDDIYGYINHDGMTTVAVLGPKVTSNRKFFANLITSSGFKSMLLKDERKLKQSLTEKMKYCQTIVMDKESVKNFYDKEVPEFT